MYSSIETANPRRRACDSTSCARYSDPSRVPERRTLIRKLAVRRYIWCARCSDVCSLHFPMAAFMVAVEGHATCVRDVPIFCALGLKPSETGRFYLQIARYNRLAPRFNDRAHDSIISYPQITTAITEHRAHSLGTSSTVKRYITHKTKQNIAHASSEHRARIPTITN